MWLSLPLKKKSRVLVAGAGGGFDVVCGVPAATALKEAGHQVFLASYSFTALSALAGVERPLPQLTRVNGDSHGEVDYFPEKYLACWWRRTFGEEMDVWCFDKLGVAPTLESYRYLKESLALDAVVLVDGGVDGLFIGNETDLGTPSMDAVSILSAAALDLEYAYFVNTAFGTEGRGYEIRHADVLRRMAELVAARALVSVGALAPGTREAGHFLTALQDIHRRMDPTRHSIIAGSIRDALGGAFGETAVSVRTMDAPVWVSPLTLLYWAFDLKAVAERKPYGKDVMNTMEVREVGEAIEKVRRELGVLNREDIPI